MAQTPPAIGGRVSRRDFLKLMAAAGTVMTFAPFVDWGKFLPNPSSNEGQKVKAELIPRAMILC
jgi:rieske iron-sulfur protein